MSIELIETEKETENNIKYTGIVKFFNTFKGYGFIIPDETLESGRDLYVHHSKIIVKPSEFATLIKNDEVEFEIHETDRGFEARNVIITKEAPYTIQRWDTFY
jgi:cold shock CspA family protein